MKAKSLIAHSSPHYGATPSSATSPSGNHYSSSEEMARRTHLELFALLDWLREKRGLQPSTVIDVYVEHARAIGKPEIPLADQK